MVRDNGAVRGRDCGGVTLVEMMISLAVFGVLLSVLGSSFTLCFRAYTKGDEKASDFREIAVSMEQMTREMRMCEAIYCPQESALRSGFYPRSGSTYPLIMRVRGRHPEVVGYTLDGGTHTIVRILYGNDFDVSDPETHAIKNEAAQLRRLSRGIERLMVLYSRHGNDEFLEVEMRADRKEGVPSIQTKVGLLRAFTLHGGQR